MDSEFGTRRGLRGFSINRLIPNVLTLAALCSGLTAIRFGLQGEFPLAVIAIIVAAIFDALDGRVARRLGVTSRFGAELDSLSDFLCFGVAPALVLYLASLRAGGALGWVVALMFPICSALRLARFNTALLSDTPPPAWTGSYFTGVPAPAGAGATGIELRDRCFLAASSPACRGGAGRGWRPDGQYLADFLVQEGQGAASPGAAGPVGSGAGDGNRGQFTVDRSFPAGAGLCLPDPVQLARLSPSRQAGCHQWRSCSPACRRAWGASRLRSGRLSGLFSLH